MIRSVRFLLAIALLLAVCSLSNVAYAQFAQRQRDSVPLKQWPAPLYWLPNASEDVTIRAKLNTSSRLKDSTADVTSQLTQAPAGAQDFVAITPCRIVDTRAGQGFAAPFGPPSLSGGVTRTSPLQSSTTCSIPSTAQAYSLSVTVVPPGAGFPGNVNQAGALGFLTIWPTGVAQPTVSTLNSVLGTILANAAIVPAGTSGSVDVFASNNTDLIIDINGFYAAQTCVKGFDEAFALHPANYTLVQTSITPSAPTVQTQLRAVVDHPTYATLLTTARNLAASFTNGRIVITLTDGTVVIDTGKPDDPTNINPGQANSFQHFTNKNVNENHNSRLAIFVAQEYP